MHSSRAGSVQAPTRSSALVKGGMKETLASLPMSGVGKQADQSAMSASCYNETFQKDRQTVPHRSDFYTLVYVP